MNGVAHMWNIVQLTGQNDLVDVTNCDDGTVGYPGQAVPGGNRRRSERRVQFPVLC